MSGQPTESVEQLRHWYVEHVFGEHGDFDVIDAFDPSTGAVFATVPVCDAVQVNRATTQARAAQRAWARTTVQERGRLMTACADRLAAIGDELAVLLAFESGKALETECRGEVGLVVEIFRYFGGVSHELKGHTTPLGTDVIGFTTRHPHGVVAGIVPWNVPLMMMGYKVAAPLVAGNAAVVKVPEQTSFTLIRVLQELVEVLPTDLVHFLTGTGDITGASLVSDPNVDKVSFTGSVDTGRAVYEASAKLIRPVTLELGGKSPMLVLPDCDIDKAVHGVVQSMRFTRGGQSCTAASRVFIASSMIEEFRRRLAAALDDIVIGEALDPATQCGPLISARQRDRVQAYIDGAIADGLTVETYGTIAEGTDWDGGYFVRPCVVLDPPADHRVAVEEVFGPVVCLFTYDDIEDALQRANDSEFGLSASVWGRDITTCMRLADALEAGIVQINQNAIMVPGIAYGGIRNSGLGKEGSLEAMLESYTYAKTNILNYGD
ncbi:MAG: aldehyde dehydrogenase family protein [Acidimicrobiales bacterium]